MSEEESMTNAATEEAVGDWGAQTTVLMQGDDGDHSGNDNNHAVAATDDETSTGAAPPPPATTTKEEEEDGPGTLYRHDTNKENDVVAESGEDHEKPTNEDPPVSSTTHVADEAAVPSQAQPETGKEKSSENEAAPPAAEGTTKEEEADFEVDADEEEEVVDWSVRIEKLAFLEGNVRGYLFNDEIKSRRAVVSVAKKDKKSVLESLFEQTLQSALAVASDANLVLDTKGMDLAEHWERSCVAAEEQFHREWLRSQGFVEHHEAALHHKDHCYVNFFVDADTAAASAKQASTAAANKAAAGGGVTAAETQRLLGGTHRPFVPRPIVEPVVAAAGCPNHSYVNFINPEGKLRSKTSSSSHLKKDGSSSTSLGSSPAKKEKTGNSTATTTTGGESNLAGNDTAGPSKALHQPNERVVVDVASSATQTDLVAVEEPPKSASKEEALLQDVEEEGRTSGGGATAAVVVSSAVVKEDRTHPLLNEQSSKELILRYHQQRSFLRRAAEHCAKEHVYLPPMLLEAIQCLLTDDVPPAAGSWSGGGGGGAATTTAALSGAVHDVSNSRMHTELSVLLRDQCSVRRQHHELELTKGGDDDAETAARQEAAREGRSPGDRIRTAQQAMLAHPLHPAAQLHTNNNNNNTAASPSDSTSSPSRTVNAKAPRALLERAFEARRDGFRRKEIDTLLEYLQKGQRGEVPLDSASTLRLLRQIGDAHAALGEYQSAEHYYFDWYLVSEKVGLAAEGTKALTCLGNVAHLRGDLPAAEEWFTKARHRMGR